MLSICRKELSKACAIAGLINKNPYLFAYPIELPARAKSIKLPVNERIFAMSVSDKGPVVHPAQPLYDVLPFPNSGDRAAEQDASRTWSVDWVPVSWEST